MSRTRKYSRSKRRYTRSKKMRHRITRTRRHRGGYFKSNEGKVILK